MKKWPLFALTFLFLATPVVAATGTIDPAHSYAWGENIGYINFAPTDSTNNYVGLTVTDTAITGYAWSSQLGWINFSPSHGGVTNDTAGELGGTAWVAGLGWLPMTGVLIDQNGKFTGLAGTSGSTVGQVWFDCTHCDVETTWRPSASSTMSTSTPPSNGGGGSSTSIVPTASSGTSGQAATATGLVGGVQQLFSLADPTHTNDYTAHVARNVGSVLTSISSLLTTIQVNDTTASPVNSGVVGALIGLLHTLLTTLMKLF